MAFEVAARLNAPLNVCGAANVDDIVCLELPRPFHGVSASYADFNEVTETDVRALYDAARVRARRMFLD